MNQPGKQTEPSPEESAAAAAMLNGWKKKQKANLAILEQQRLKLETHVLQLWKKPLDLLDILLAVSSEFGSNHNDTQRPHAAAERDHVFEVLSLIHARSCQVGGEVRLLLHGGYSDGAMARWRTEYELAVVALFIKKFGNDVAERYLLHESVEAWRITLNCKEHPETGEVTAEELKKAENAKNAVCAKYPSEHFESRYGWANKALKVKKANFSNIEVESGISHLDPYYKMASGCIHAGVQGDRFRLSHPDGKTMKVLVAGPSDWGLADPGQNLAISTYQICSCYMLHRPIALNVAMLRAMKDLMHETNNAFALVHFDMMKKCGSAPC